MFRKNSSRKFGWSRSEDDPDTGQEDAGLPPNRIDQSRGRLTSEPTINLHPSPSHVQRHRSSAGSEVPLFSSQFRLPSPANTSSSPDPLGLTLVHAFPEPLLDLVFVHGLGGTSTRTWSFERDPANFWPPWLGQDSDLSRTRIFTFGYNASVAGQFTSLNMLDFAKDLLFRMKTFSNDDQPQDSPIGKFPIIFVVHSMGGLVVKKAYIIGKSDQQYSEIIARVGAIVFLATPHKGSELAPTLNSILRATPGGSAKAYVAELEKNSSLLQDINEQFRTICGDLELVSFHETLKTSLGAGIKRIIVERDSAILGYPTEISSSLIADHHGMTKFKSSLDTNYLDIRNTLRWLMKKIVDGERADLTFARKRDQQLKDNSDLREEEYDAGSDAAKLASVFGIVEKADDDLEYFADRTMEGSCLWLSQREAFRAWVESKNDASRLLWLTGGPGTGKSTCASFVISLLKESSPGHCQYHFFSAGHQLKRTVSYLLRSLALQTALSHPAFCKQLLELHENTKIDFSQQKAITIWERIFEGILFRLPNEGSVYWVFDGLDEAESPTELIKLLSKVTVATNIQILLVSRMAKDLQRDIDHHLPSTVHEAISDIDTKDDIRDYVRSLVQKISLSDQSQEDIIQDILAKASGSFLWVKLALDKMGDNLHTQDDIRSALTEIPEGMEPLYQRMINIIADQSPRPCEMAKRILTWVACAFRPLDVAELQVALASEFGSFINLKTTAEEICGHFLVVNKTKITLIHQTAHQFLLHKTENLRIEISEPEGHKHIAVVCLDFLTKQKWRRTFSVIQMYQQSKQAKFDHTAFAEYPFLFYALHAWAYHVSKASIDSDDLLDTVLNFLEEHCLSWINGVALSGTLHTLTRAAKHLKTYIRRRATALAKSIPASFARTRDPESRQWATDLIRVVGRFGNNIAENPASIHKHVVPFCPRGSIIYRSLSHRGHSAFSVTGVSSNSWDDCLARLTMGEDRTASKVLCKDTFFITLIGGDGTLLIWYAESCEEARRITHGEWVSFMASSKTSNLVATAGIKTTRIWDVTTGRELHRLVKAPHLRTKAIAFGAKDEEILIAYDDCTISCIDLATYHEKWRFLAKEPWTEDHNCARYMSFSPDLTQIAIVFRGKPVLVWSLQPDSPVYTPPKKGVCTEDKYSVQSTAWNAPELVLWQPVTDHLLILYEDTKILHWNIEDGEQSEHSHTGARVMVLSSDGNLLLTSDNNGTLSIWMVPGYHLTYQLRYEELVGDLAFSPDGTRFYDLRGSFCNVWEPDALVRPDDFDLCDMSSTHETSQSDPVLASDDNDRVQITALACDSSDRFYCCGKEDGTVSIFELPDGRKIRKLFGHSTTVSIIKITWSQSEKYIASADDSGRVIAKRLEPPKPLDPKKWAVFPLFELRVTEAIEHFLFSTNEDYLLIAGPTIARVIGIRSKKELCHISHDFGTGSIWVNHPRDPTMLIGMKANEERQYLWKSLTPKDESRNTSLEALSIAKSVEAIHSTVLIRGHFLFQEILASSGHYNRHIEMLDLYNLCDSGPTTNLRQRIEGLAKHVARLIGCYQDRVVFLDHQFWLCTWEMEMTYTKHNRHFFLPKDWLSPTNLKLLILNKQGTLLCPRNGEVAIVGSGLKSG